MTDMTIVTLLSGSYLLGSLPFGLWLARWWKGVDIRTLGSGNIGSTNVGRICGPVAGAVVFAFDVGKGLLPPLVGHALGLDSQWLILAAMLAIIGHNYSVWLGFKGGKGIATSLGALLGVAPPVGLVAFVLFALEIVTLRWVSVGSIIGALSLPVLMPIFYPGDYYRLAFGTLACIMAVYKHRANIQRLRNRTEPKIQLPWTKKPDAPTETTVSNEPTEKVTEDDDTHDSAHTTQNSELRTQNSLFR
jgi:acyl phosphate:glycerol-3-phosphate acyltransferase